MKERVIYEGNGVRVSLRRLINNSELIIDVRESDEELRRKCYELLMKYYDDVLKHVKGKCKKKDLRFLEYTVAKAPLRSYHVVHQEVGSLHIGIGDVCIWFRLPHHIIEGMLRDGIVKVVKEWAERAKT